ncbi:MAG: hypothetical protein ACR2NR_05945 [Solirubrobacteraceae bacterium]
MTIADRSLLRRGLALEYTTLAWNVVGTVVLVLAAAVLAGFALHAAPGWWWADPASALVILVHGLREARHAWAQANLGEIVTLVALALPLGLGTFAVAAALGGTGLEPRRRLRGPRLMARFDAGMPLVGLALGAPLGHAVGAAGGHPLPARTATRPGSVRAVPGGPGRWFSTNARTRRRRLVGNAS